MRKILKSILSVITFPFRALWWLVSLPFRSIRRAGEFLTGEPEEHPLDAALRTSLQEPSSFLDHLNALRKHLLRILVALGICVVLMFNYTPRLVEFLTASIGGLSELTAIDVTESVGVYMKVALFGALAIASPYIAFEIWLFAAPGLKAPARKFGLLGIPLVAIFFIGGIAFAYYLMLPTALPFLLDFMGVQAQWRISSYINFVTGLLFWIGLAFEFPLVIYILSLMGIIKPKMLVNQWRIAIIVIAIVAAAATPTPDPINMVLVMAPMVVLYFISIILSYLANLGKRRREEADEAS